MRRDRARADSPAVDGGRRQRLQGIALAVGVTGVVLSIATVMPATQAAFTDTAANAGNSFAAAATFAQTFYLHNNPSPPVSSTGTQVNLPLDTNAPTATILRNYDTDKDVYPGLMIYKGGGLSEADPSKYQRWRHITSAALTINGNVTLHLWTATKAFDTGKGGAIVVGLYDCNSAGESCSLITSTTVIDSTWPSAWEEKQIALGTISHTIATGRSLVIHVAPIAASADDLWFAYDTTTYNSRLRIN
jgi:hypothetical protein